MKKCNYCGLSYVGTTCPYCVQSPESTNDDSIFVPDTSSSDFGSSSSDSSSSDSSLDFGGGDAGGAGAGGDW